MQAISQNRIDRIRDISGRFTRPESKNILPDGVLIDDEDLEKISQYNTWFIYKRGDVCCQQRTDGKVFTHKLHRVIMDCPKGLVVDHINGNRLDNRKANLRVCNNAENSRNCKLSKNNTSGFSGVIWDKIRLRWTASIKINYKTKYLGRYSTIEEAISARLFAEDHYFGSYAPSSSRQYGI